MNPLLVFLYYINNHIINISFSLRIHWAGLIFINSKQLISRSVQSKVKLTNRSSCRKTLIEESEWVRHSELMILEKGRRNAPPNA